MNEAPQQVSPYIVLMAPDGTSMKVVLSGASSWSLGRDDDNDIVLRDNSVSRHHAILQYLDSNSIYLIDLGSTNGSFVNERRVSIPTLLHNGDQLTLGQSEIEFHGDLPPPEELQDSLPGSTAKTSVLHLRRLISVMVVDIRGFTQLTQLVDERLLSKVLGEWFRLAGTIIRQKGSSVDKYIGDAIMAVWLHGSVQEEGEPEHPPSRPDVLPIFKALAELFEMTQALNERFPELPQPIRLGAGINTGYAIVGQMGTGERQEYTVIGDTVNAAFRLESVTRMLDADWAISEETHAALWAQRQSSPAKTFFSCEDVNLKGYSKTHRVYYCRFHEVQEFLQSVVA
ncbi:MAG: adenylate/guanylate cyclase domain-containing protein [Synechococcaceae cyanobacterium SM2_3_1]|nr:adenylate/guanylate cyclase domain-containing protein [Synechococcaceae cyanobacterium SM2_3_1]